MKKYVVIGSSAAGVNGIRELRKYDKDAEIVLISKDKDIYSRCILHEYLAGKRSIERLRFVEKDFETLYRVNWKKGIEAVGLDRAAKEVKFVEDVSLKKAYLYMNTKMAKENDIHEMDQVRVYSVNGENAVFHVKITDNVPYDQLYAPIHYIECNKLTPSSYDKYSREPNYKGATCRFEKV